jgi:hypothetical protein
MKRLIFIVLFAPLFLQAQLKNSEVSLALNFMTESDDLYFAEADRYYYVGDALLFKADFSFFPDAFGKRFGIGIYSNLGSPWYDGFEETFTTEFGPLLKWKLVANKITFIPTLYIGYRSYEGDAGDGMGLNFSVLTQFSMDNFNPFIDIGFMSQPAGGNDATDITYGPVLIIGGGVTFGL